MNLDQTSENQETDNYQDLLLREFESRKSRRPGFSLRAFARVIGLTPSHLSDVLSRRSGLSIQAATAISEKLGFNRSETEYFVDLVESQHARSKADKQAALKRLEIRRMKKNVLKLEEEEFELFSNWKTLALLELIEIESSSKRLDHLAAKLQSTESEIAQILELLTRSGVLKVQGGRFVRGDAFIKAESPKPQAVIRNFHKQIAQLAIERIDQAPIPTRKNLSSVISIDSERIEEARKYLERMHEEFLKQFATDKNANCVYAISQNLFRLDEGLQT